MLSSQDVSATSGCNEDLTLRSSLGHSGDLETRNGSLESVDRINLGDDDTSTERAESISTALSDISVTGNNSGLSGNHDIGGTFDTIEKRFTASVKVVELGLCDGIVDVNSGNQQFFILKHFVQMVDTGGSLLGDTIAILKKVRVLVMDKGSEITAVVEDQVELLAILEGKELLLQTPVVLLFGLALPGEA